MANSNDYWRGGWANNPGLMTANLPGTQAAMLDQRMGGNYGPVNALADILGAYFNKRNQEGMLSYVSKDLPKELDTLTAPEPSQAEREKYSFDVGKPQFKYGQQAPSQFGQYYDFLHKNGPELNPVMQAGANAPGVLQAMQDFAKLDPNLPQNRGPGYYDLGNAEKEKQYANDKLYLSNNGYSDADADALLNQQPQYRGRADAVAFRQNKQEHPEQFVGNTYVGTDENAKKQAIAKQAQEQQERAAFMQREAQRNAPRYLSYQEVRDKAQQMKADALLRISKKYGMDAAKQAEPMIETAINNRLNDYGGAQLTAKRAQIDDMVQRLGDNINTPQGTYSILRTAQEYNIMAKQMGQPVFDTALLGQYLKSGETTLVKSNAGGTINWYVTKKNGTRFDDGSYVKPVMREAVSMKPGEAANLKFKYANMENSNRQKELDRQNSRYIAAVRAVSKSSSSSSGRGSSKGGADFNNKAVSGRVTDMLAAGQTPTQVHDALINAGMSEEQAAAYLTPSVIEYYHQVNGDEAPE